MLPTADCYLRVSSVAQHPENQRASVAALARSRGFEPVIWEERESAVKDRPVLDEVCRRAYAGESAAVVCWALDRLSRGGIAETLRLLQLLEERGVQVYSVQEPWVSERGPIRDVVIAILAWAAQQERARMLERIRLGIERARAEGRPLGRPRSTRAAELAPRIAALRAQGLGWRRIGALLGLPPRTASHWCKIPGPEAGAK